MIESRELNSPSPARNPSPERTKNGRVYVPKVDIYETKEVVVLIADLPGADERSVDVTIEKNILTITASVEPADGKNYRLVYSEFTPGDYQRSFTLSEEIDRDKVEAVIKNGVLRLVLPKLPQATAKKVAIKAS